MSAAIREKDRVRWQFDPVLLGTVRGAVNGVVRVDWDEGGYSVHKESDLIRVPDAGGGDG